MSGAPAEYYRCFCYVLCIIIVLLMQSRLDLKFWKPYRNKNYFILNKHYDVIFWSDLHLKNKVTKFILNANSPFLLECRVLKKNYFNFCQVLYFVQIKQTRKHCNAKKTHELSEEIRTHSDLAFISTQVRLICSVGQVCVWGKQLLCSQSSQWLVFVSR